MKKHQRHTVTVLRLPESLRNPDQIETDALNGISSIHGVTEAEIETADDDSVTLSYLWSGTEKFQTTDEHLRQFGLRRRWKMKLNKSNPALKPTRLRRAAYLGR